jgi:hypothetical protein
MANRMGSSSRHDMILLTRASKFHQALNLPVSYSLYPFYIRMTPSMDVSVKLLHVVVIFGTSIPS